VLSKYIIFLFAYCNLTDMIDLHNFCFIITIIIITLILTNLITYKNISLNATNIIIICVRSCDETIFGGRGRL